MDAEKQREIARKGGRAAHQKGTAHEFTPDEARAAGRKGGERVSSNREHMSRIGRMGGKSSAQRRSVSAQRGAETGAAPQQRAHAPRGEHANRGDFGDMNKNDDQGASPGTRQPGVTPEHRSEHQQAAAHQPTRERQFEQGNEGGVEAIGHDRSPDRDRMPEIESPT